MSELRQLKFPAIYSQLAKDFLEAAAQNSTIELSITKGLRLLNIPSSILETPEARLNGEQVSLLISLGAWLARKNTPFSLQVLQNFKEDSLGMLGLAIINADTAEQALEHFQKYAEIFIPGFDFSLQYQEKTLDIVILPLADFKTIQAHVIELIIGIFDYYVKRAGLRFKGEFYVTHKIEASYKKQLSDAFDSTISCLSPLNKIRIPRSALEQKVKAPNSSMHAFYVAQLEADLLNHAQQESSASKARRVLYHNAKQSRFLNRDQLADALSCSHRTLTRKLKAEGTSFQKLLDEVRFTMSKQALAQSSKSTQLVANSIGITNSAVFCRSFKKWCGMTPSEYRDQASSNL